MSDLVIEKDSLDEYLKPSAIIDFENESIIETTDLLTLGIEDEFLKVKRIYEYVRDEISHSFDIGGQVVTCRASEVLREKQGICYAKSHLLAALLRYINMPTGFCYQGLILSDNTPRIVLHGLNAVYLKGLNKWIRLDARGNKEGVNAQISIGEEKLAFPVRPELGEFDEKVVFAEPNKNVVLALKMSKTIDELLDNLPDEL